MRVTWSAEMLHDLRALHGSGMMFKTIARVLSEKYGVELSKSACIGKFDRLRRMPSAAIVNLERARKASMPIEPRPRRLKPGARVSLYDLRHEGCKWPYGTGSATLFCGALRQDGHPYCKFHCEMAYRSLERR